MTPAPVAPVRNIKNAAGKIINMNNQELKTKTRNIAAQLMNKKKYIAPVDLLMKLGYLNANDHEKWRKGQVAYLEQVCQVNLKKLSTIMKILRDFSKEQKYYPSYTAYNGWGKNKGKKLKFSKSGTPYIEQAYATHYVNPALKERE